MRKRLAVAGAAALVLVAGSMSLATAESSDTASGDGRTVKIIRLVVQPVAVTQLDLGEEGASQGDQIIFADDLFRDGRKVGEDGIVCTLVRLQQPSAIYDCGGTASLPGGQITARGLVALPPGPEPFVIAITGGTGAYRTAHGELKVRVVSPDEEHYTLKLIL